MVSGILIALEGIDGSGKGTQAAVLHQRLNAAGIRTTLLSFPRYAETAFGRQIGRFLNGEFGTLDQVSPWLAALLFAGDRFESKSIIETSLAENSIVLCDRYVASNIAHQAAKLRGGARQELVNWIDHLEYALYLLPRPRLTIWLDVPVPYAQRLIATKSKRSYTEKSADLQEADPEYLQHVREVYAELAAAQSGWRRIDCLSAEALRSVADIAEDMHHTVLAAWNCSGDKTATAPG
jgi:dTMP kinase